MTTIQSALTEATRRLADVQTTPRLDAQVLLCEAMQIEPVTVYSHPERELNASEEERFQSWLARRLQGEPIAYILGHKEFYGLDFLVDKRVLIPRPETELLVEHALKAIDGVFREGRTPVVADIGTGSGAIPVTLAVNEPRLPYVYAVDISDDALAVATLNVQHHHLEERIRLLKGDLLAPLPEPVDVLTANLPYVGTSELGVMSNDVVDYEPHLALFSGPSGIDLLSRFFASAFTSSILKKGSVLLLEIGYQQKQVLQQLLQASWPEANVSFYKDYAGWDRVMQVIL